MIFAFISCKKEPSSIFGKMHRSLEKIESISEKLASSDAIIANYDVMKNAIENFHANVKEFGNLSIENLKKLEKDNKQEVEDFSKYLNKLLDEQSNNFVSNMKRIGSANLEGQKLRNGFFEVIYLFTKSRLGKSAQATR